MRKVLKILGAVLLFLFGLYWAFLAVFGLVIAWGEPGAWTFVPLLIPAGAFIAVAIAIFKWARE